MIKELKIIRAATFLLVALIFLGIRSQGFTSTDPRSTIHDARNSSEGVYYTVSRVIDGDTIVLSDGRKVRLIGVDTPEIHYTEKLVRDSKNTGQKIKTIQSLGRRASAFTKDLCLGKKVRLEYDVDRKDRYKRTLAYVYLEDGVFVNARIIQEGFAQVLTIPPNVKYADLFLRLQQEARALKKGLWKI